MIHVFINSPNPHITIHRNPNCGYIHRHTIKPVQRREMNIYRENLSDSFLIFKNNKFDFRAEAGWNSLWLKLDLGDYDSEMDVVNKIMKYLGGRYTPLANLTPKIHC